MAEGGDEIAESPDPQPSPTNSFVVRKDGSADLNYPVGTFLSVSGGPCVPIILISSISDQLLVSVPLEAWHRLKANRRLPGDALSKAVSVEVPAVRDLDREVIEFEQKIKVWVGYLKKSLESCLNFEPDYAVALACQFMTEDGGEGFVPFAESLVTLADEKFSFLSAMSGAEGDGEKPSDPSSKAKKASDPALDRIARLEEGMVAIQTSLQELLSQRNTVAAAPPVMTPKPKEKAKRPEEDGLEALDPQVVQSALISGIDRKQLEEFNRLVAAHKPKLTDTPAQRKGARGPVNILGESEDEAVPEIDEEALAADPGAAFQTAIVKLTSIVQNLSSKKKGRSIEDLLDDSLAVGEASSSSSSISSNRRHSYLLKVLRQSLKEAPEEIYKVIEGRMLADFGAQESAPGEPVRSGTFRGWAEHRSKIPNLNPSVRAVWAVTGALDALKRGRVSEAKARLALYLCQLDQVSVDRGQWILAAEGSLEDPPPFSSFSKHTPPDLLEPQHTRLWPTAWAESFMYKVKELDEFVERRSKLGKRSQAAQHAAPAAEESPKKGSGKKGNPKSKAKASPEEPSQTQL